MFTTNNKELDRITFDTMLLLSGGQKLTLNDLAKLALNNIASTEPVTQRVWPAIQSLISRGFVAAEKGKYMITFDGVEFLSRQGYTATEPGDDPSVDMFKNKFKVTFFGSWSELLQWGYLPLILIFLGIVVAFIYIISYKSETQQILDTLSIIALILIFTILFFYIKKSYRNVSETEKMVVFRLGKPAGIRESGPALIIPIIDKSKLVDTREKSKEIKNELCLTKDRILVHVGLLIRWTVDDPVKSLMKVVDAEETMHLFTIAVLRSAISEFDLNDVMTIQSGIGNIVRIRIERIVGEWGLSISSLEIKDIKPPEGLLQTIEKRFIANIESETTLTQTDAQVESLRKLFAIGSQLDEKTFRLKYLETLTKIGEGPSTKYIIPMEFVHLLGDWLQTQLSKTSRNK